MSDTNELENSKDSHDIVFCRHVILLCYLQLRFLDSHASVSDALVLTSSALELCKEPYLQVLRNRVIILMDNLRLHGGFTPHLPLSSKRCDSGKFVTVLLSLA